MPHNMPGRKNKLNNIRVFEILYSLVKKLEVMAFVTWSSKQVVTVDNKYFLKTADSLNVFIFDISYII